MAVFNAGGSPHRQYFYGKSNEQKPIDVYIGDKFFEIDTSQEYIFDGNTWIAVASSGGGGGETAGSGVSGTATGGSATTIVDTTKNFQTNVFDGCTVKITINDIDYFRFITATAGDTITIDSLGAETVTDGCPYVVID